MSNRRFPVKNKTLLVNITRLGDMLQATPTIAGIKQENPDSKLTVLVERQFEAICHLLPGIDEVVAIDLSRTVQGIAAEGEGLMDAYDYVSDVIDDLKSKNYDFCLNMSSSGYTALLLKMLGIEHTGGWTSDEEGNRVIESEWARLFATSVFHQNRQFNSLNLVDVFRCSADVVAHPHRLLMTIPNEARDHARRLIAESEMSAAGPLVVLQAGASQGKRQWAPSKFVQLIRDLRTRMNARVILVGTQKERVIIDPIIAEVNDRNVVSFAGRTSIPQLSAVLAESAILVTGDTGTMHMAVAVGTPVVSMFLASAYGFETGPYSPENIVIQPVIGCGPCNPNKACARPDCHDNIPPELVSKLVELRLAGPIEKLPADFVDPQKAIIYRTFFDEAGLYDMQALSPTTFDQWKVYRDAYRRMWVEDLSGMKLSAPKKVTSLSVVTDGLVGLNDVISCADEGVSLMHKLDRAVRDTSVTASEIGKISEFIAETDRRIEGLGFHNPPLGPVTRMFIFGKENLHGTDALELASQMRGYYTDLKRRCVSLASHFSQVA